MSEEYNFKNTEIGRIPREWVRDLRFSDVRLGD